MKIVCEKLILEEALVNVSRGTSIKSSIPALLGILLKAEGDTLYLSGYDLDIGISTKIKADVEESGEIILSAKLLSDIVKRMTSQKVNIEVGDKNLTTVKGGNVELTLTGIESIEYPEMPSFTAKAVMTINSKLLLSMLSQTLFSVATSDLKPVHIGVLFEISSDDITLVGVDGFRMALRKEITKNEEETKFVVPARVLSEIIKMQKEEDENITLKIGKKHITFEFGGYKILSRLLEGDFLNYKNAIPKEMLINVKVNTKDFINSLERVSLLTSEKIKSPVVLNFKDDELLIKCATTIGKIEDNIKCEINGGEIEIGFNNKYILDALKNSECDIVKIEMSTPVSPMVIRPPDGDNLLYLILPVRLSHNS